MRTRQLYASLTASSAGTYYFDLPDNSRIRQVLFCATPTSNGAGDYVELELSVASSAQHSTNDAQGIIAASSFVTTGTGTPGYAQNTAPLNQLVPTDYPMRKGERVYFNINESGSATWRLRCIVWFD